MLNDGIEQVTIDNIAKKTGVDKEKINNLFQYDDKELVMDVMEYAGIKWVEEIKLKIKNTNDRTKKLETLIYGYTMGSKEYPQSLSSYIDMWKIIKDNEDEYIKLRLKTIYNYYISEFTNIVEDIGCEHIPYNERIAFGTFVTLLSDVIHIQSLVIENKLDFDCLVNVVNRLAKQFFIGEI